MRHIIYFIVCLFLLAGCSLTSKNVNIDNQSKETALEVANVVFEKHKKNTTGYEFIVKIDENNTIWNDYISNVPFFEWNPQIEVKLNGRDYWAILYTINMDKKEFTIFDGELWVFVDRNTNELIMSTSMTGIKYY